MPEKKRKRDRIVHTTVVQTNPEDHKNNGGEDAEANDHNQTNKSYNHHVDTSRRPRYGCTVRPGIVSMVLASLQHFQKIDEDAVKEYCQQGKLARFAHLFLARLRLLRSSSKLSNLFR